MADYLASIFGTEKDKVNCSFYLKIGACRHGERCSRIHTRPTFSATILLQNFYQNPANAPHGTETSVQTEEELAQQYEEFYEDVFWEMEEKYGKVEEMNVCDNMGDHLIGNVYIMFEREEDAERAVQDLNNRWFNGRPIYAELSPVTDFGEASCRQYELEECTRGGYCNFMHIKPISQQLRRKLFGGKLPSYMRDRERERNSPKRARGSGDHRSGYGGGGRGWEGGRSERDYRDRDYRDHRDYRDRDYRDYRDRGDRDRDRGRDYRDRDRDRGRDYRRDDY
eukprot:m.211866 g.211866  ORF g.211866 m.211866 type:complete len:281 (+) comp19044_c0_seq1:51-893(+)